MKNKPSYLHVFFCICMFAALGCVIAAFAVFDYNFKVPFAEMWSANTAAFVLLAAFVALNVVLIVSSICLRVKRDKRTYGEVALAFQITAIVLLEVVFCVPIFIAFVAEKIQDAILSRDKEMP